MTIRCASWLRFLVTLLACALAIVLWPQRAWAFTPPAKLGAVTDQAHVLDPATQSRVEQKLVAYNQRNGFTLAVLTVDNLDGMTVEDFAYKTAKEWQLGDAQRDDGVLLLIAKSERKIRIETGKGADGVLTDLQTNIIIREVIGPRLKRGEYSAGIEGGVDAICAALSQLPIPEQLKSGAASGRKSGGGFGSAVIIVGFVFLTLLLIFARWIAHKTFGNQRTNSRWNNNAYDRYGHSNQWHGHSYGNSWSSGDTSSSWSSGDSGSSGGGSDFGSGGGDFGGGGSSGDY